MEITKEQFERMGLDPSTRLGPGTTIFEPNKLEPEDFMENIAKIDQYHLNDLMFGCVRVVTRIETRVKNGYEATYSVSTILHRPRGTVDPQPYTMFQEVESEDSVDASHQRAINQAEATYSAGKIAESLETVRIRTPMKEEDREVLYKDLYKSKVLILPEPGGWANKIPAESREQIATDQLLIRLVATKETTPDWKVQFTDRIQLYVDGYLADDLGTGRMSDYLPSDLDKVQIAEAYGPYQIGTDMFHKGDVIVDTKYFLSNVALPFGKI